MGRGHSTGITIPKASLSEICENHGAGALRWNATGRGNSTRITIPKASRSEICENHGAGELRWNPRGGGTQLELLSLRLPGQRYVRTTGRGLWTGIFLHKGAWSDICQYHGAGALDWNFPP